MRRARICVGCGKAPATTRRRVLDEGGLASRPSDWTDHALCGTCAAELDKEKSPRVWQLGQPQN